LARGRISKTLPSFVIWLRETTKLRGEITIDNATTIALLGSIGFCAIDKYYEAGAFFLFAVGGAIKVWHAHNEKERTVQARTLLSDIMDTAGDGLNKAISLVEPDIMKFCVVTRRVMYAVYLALMLASIAVTSIIVSAFIKSISHMFGYTAPDKLYAQNATPVAVAAMLCAVVGADYKLGNMLRAFTYLYSSTTNIIKDVFDFEQYKTFINKACVYFKKPPPFQVADWISDIDAYEMQYLEFSQDPMLHQRMVTDESMPADMRHFTENLAILNKQIRGQAIVPAVEKQKVARMYEWALKQLKTIAQINHKFARRICPLTLSIIGGPGLGKTDAVECFSNALYYALHDKEMQASECYPDTNGKYYDAYNEGTWWFHIPEFLGSGTPLVNEEPATLYRNMVGTDAIPMNCASLEKKDTVSFCSRLTDTGNRPYAYQKCGLSNHRALSRRVMFPLTMTRGTNFDDSFTAQDFDNAWTFMVAPDVVANKDDYQLMWHELKINQTYTFMEILEMLEKCYKSLELKSNFADKAVLMMKGLKGHATVQKVAPIKKEEVVLPADSWDTSEEDIVEIPSFEDDLSSELQDDKSTMFIEDSFDWSSNPSSFPFGKDLSGTVSTENSINDKGKSRISSSGSSSDYSSSDSDSSSSGLSMRPIEFVITIKLYLHGIEITTLDKQAPFRRLVMQYGLNKPIDHEFKGTVLLTKDIKLEYIDYMFYFQQRRITPKKHQLLPIFYMYFNQTKVRNCSVAIIGTLANEEFPQTTDGKYVSEANRKYHEYYPGHLAIKIDDMRLWKEAITNEELNFGFIQTTNDFCSLQVATSSGRKMANVEDILRSRAVLHTSTLNGGVDDPIIVLKNPPDYFTGMWEYGASLKKYTAKWVWNTIVTDSLRWKMYTIVGVIVTVLLASVATVIAVITGAFGPLKKDKPAKDNLKAEGCSYWYDHDGVKHVATKAKKKPSKTNKVSSTEVLTALSGLKGQGSPEQDSLRFGANLINLSLASEDRIVKTWIFMINDSMGYIVNHSIPENLRSIEVSTMLPPFLQTRLIGRENFSLSRPNKTADIVVVYFKEPIPGVSSIARSIVRTGKDDRKFSRLNVITDGKKRGITISAMTSAPIQMGPYEVENPDPELPSFMVEKFHYMPDATTSSGFCGLPYITIEDGAYKVAGIHFAGSNTFAAFHGLIHADVEKDIRSSPFLKLTAECPPAIFEHLLPEFEEQAGLINLGKLSTKPSFTPKSRVKQSPLADVPCNVPLPQLGMRPATLVGPTASRTFKFDRKGKLVDNDVISNFIYKGNMLKDFAPLKDFANLPDPNSLELEDFIFGNETMKGFDDTSSVGPMYKRGFHPSKFIPADKQQLFCTKTRFISPAFRSDYEQRIEVARSGKMIMPVVERALKEEVRSVDEKGIYRCAKGRDNFFYNFRDIEDPSVFIKEKEDQGFTVMLDIEPREFYPSDPIDILESKSILWPVLQAMHKNFMLSNSVVGINPISPEWKVLEAQVRKPTWKPIFFDIKSCDKTIVEAFWNVVFTYFQSLCQFKKGSSKWHRLRAACWKLLHFVYFANNYVYIIDGSNPSGQWLTCLLNGMWVHFVYKSIFKFICKQQHLTLKFSDNVIAKTFGDDGVISVSPAAQVFFNRRSIAVGAKVLFNVVFTSLDKRIVYTDPDNQPYFDDWNDLEFLQRKFIHRDNLVLAPLRIDSIWRSLMWSSVDFSKHCAIEHYGQILPNALLEFSLHGKEIFDNAVQILKPRYLGIGGRWDIKWDYEHLTTVVGHRLCGGCDKHSHVWN